MSDLNDNRPPQPEQAGTAEILWLMFAFDGRISREVYWLGIGLIWCVLVVLLGIVAASVGEEAMGGVILLMALAALWCELALIVKRLHDRGLPGFWCLLAFIPFAGIAWMVVVGLLPGEEGPNRYGAGPDERGNAAAGRGQGGRRSDE